MPRGYLKHNRDTSKKKARGGASSKGCLKADRDRSYSKQICSSVEDFALGVGSATASKSNVDQNAASYPIGECTICFKDGPVVCLSNKCKWHDAACQQCLHRIHVTNAQKSPKSYPLTCFHPLCNQPVHTSQLEKHNIFASPSEVWKHHEMLVLSKIYKTDGMRTVRCPKCDTPRGIRKLGDKDRVHGCINCNTKYLVSPYYATIRALDNMKSDSMGINDGWAKCPSCSILISKGDGCEHMECCYCDHEFYWDEAQEKKDRIPHARVPDEEIYLWWW